MGLTVNYGLAKPDPTENYDVAVVNANSDIIDLQLKNRQNEAAAVSTELRAKLPLSTPRCKLRQPAAQTTATGVPEVLEMGAATIDYDTNVMADKANDAIVIKTAGWYICTLRVVWATNATGTRFHLIDKLVGAVVTVLADDYRAAAPDTNTIVTLHTEPILLALNDKVRGRISQTSGGSLQTDSAGPGFSSLAVHWHRGNV